MTDNADRDPLTERNELLNSLRESAILTDVTLECDGIEFPAHRAILYCSSKYFEAMFSSCLEESRNGKVALPTVEAEEMEVILKFLYTGKFEVVEDTLLVKVFKASHFFLLQNLFQLCWQRLATGLSDKSFIAMYNLTELYGNEEMILQVVCFLSQHLPEIIKSEEFYNLSDRQLMKVVQHIPADESMMDDVLKGLLRWAHLENGHAPREQALIQMIAILNLQRISTELLSQLLHMPAIKRNYHLLLMFTAEATSRTLTSSQITETLRSQKLLYFGENDHQQHVFKTYDVARNQWSVATVLPILLEDNTSMAWFGGNVYIFGGTSPSVEIRKFCPTTNKIVPSTELNTPVKHPGVGVLSNFIYIVGRFPIKTVQRYNPLDDTCDEVSLPHNVYHNPQIFIYAGFLYSFDSFTFFSVNSCSFRNDSHFEQFDPRSNSWAEVTGMPETIIDDPRATICCNRLFLLPSCGKAKEFYVYDLSSNTWENKEFKERPIWITNLKSAHVNNKCILLALDKNGLLHLYHTESELWFRNANSYLNQMDGNHMLVI